MTDAAPASRHNVNARFNANKLKLGLFAVNADGGIATKKVRERWRVDWSDIVDVAMQIFNERGRIAAAMIHDGLIADMA
jgi:hypothetical protein